MSSIITKENCKLFATTLQFNKTSAMRQRNLCKALENELPIIFVEGIKYKRWSKENSFNLLLKLLEEFEKSDCEYGIICQDDFYPIDNFLQELNKTVELLPNTWECLHFSPGWAWGRGIEKRGVRLNKDDKKIGKFNPEKHIVKWFARKKDPNCLEKFVHESNRFFINIPSHILYYHRGWLGGPIAMLLNKRTIRAFIEKYTDKANFDHEDRILVKIFNNNSFVCKEPLLGFEEECCGTTFKNHKNNYIKIGSSETNIKKIKLDKIYPNDAELLLIHNYKDTFSYEFNNDELIITRTDENSGWDHDLVGYF